MPLFDARVQVDAKVKDRWGIPVARLSGGRHPHTIEIGRYIAGKAEEWLKEAGAVQTWKRTPPKSLSGGQHQAGTCRMGNDPKTSVVQPKLSASRSRQRLRDRCERTRHQRRLQPGPDHPGERVSRLRATVGSVEGLEGAVVKKVLLVAGVLIAASALMVPGTSL